MADRLFSSGNKSRILAIESLESDKLTIAKVAETLGFQVSFCKDDQEALTKLQQRFYQIIIVNPELSGEAVSRFIGDLRSIRGYERIPILVIAPEHLAMYASNYLDEGADGYLLKPFNEDLLFSHLNLFLRRQIFRRFHESEFLKRDLNTERGQIILCSVSKEVLDIPIQAIETEVIVVNNESELFKTLFSKNIWIVLIGVQAKWALPLVGKIKNDEAFNVQVILLRSSKALDAEVVDFFNQGGDDITS
ncbi:MAG: response regulator, partial [Bacteroidia bacterium]